MDHQIDICHFSDRSDGWRGSFQDASDEVGAPFFGRKAQLHRLQRLADKKTASIVVIKGRRRIGKSRLTDELAKALSGYSAVHWWTVRRISTCATGQNR